MLRMNNLWRKSLNIAFILLINFIFLVFDVTQI